LDVCSRNVEIAFCTMASINKISIRGVRSFSPDDQEQVVEFLFPLTIITGGKICFFFCFLFRNTHLPVSAFHYDIVVIVLVLVLVLAP
jgi:hypothetical protein